MVSKSLGINKLINDRGVREDRKTLALTVNGEDDLCLLSKEICLTNIWGDYYDCS